MIEEGAPYQINTGTNLWIGSAESLSTFKTLGQRHSQWDELVGVRKAEEDGNSLTLQLYSSYILHCNYSLEGWKALQVKGQQRSDCSYPGACDKIALRTVEWDFEKSGLKGRTKAEDPFSCRARETWKPAFVITKKRKVLKSKKMLNLARRHEHRSDAGLNGEQGIRSRWWGWRQ